MIVLEEEYWQNRTRVGMGVLTSGGVQSSATSVTLEVFCLLMGDEQFEILEVTFA